jgi:hypothetical protein
MGTDVDLCNPSAAALATTFTKASKLVRIIIQTGAHRTNIAH